MWQKKTDSTFFSFYQKSQTHAHSCLEGKRAQRDEQTKRGIVRELDTEEDNEKYKETPREKHS